MKNLQYLCKSIIIITYYYYYTSNSKQRNEVIRFDDMNDYDTITNALRNYIHPYPLPSTEVVPMS